MSSIFNRLFGPSPCKVIDIDAPNRLSFSWDTDGWIVTFILRIWEIGRSLHSFMGAGSTLIRFLRNLNEKSSVVRDKMAHGWVGIVNERIAKGC